MLEENPRDKSVPDSKWAVLEEYFRKNLPVMASVKKATLEYICVDVDGVDGIIELPAFDFSPLGERAQDQCHIDRQLELMQDRKMLLRIVEFDKTGGRLLLKPCNYAFDAEDKRRERLRPLLQKLQPGDIHTAVVTELESLHAVVDLNGVEGRIPLFYISRSLVYHPRKVLRRGQKVRVIILDVLDTWCELSLVHAQMFEAARRRIKTGEVRRGRIISLRAEGVYLDLGDIIGLLPAELVVSGYITHPADLYYKGQELSVCVDYITAEFMPILSRASFE